LKYIEVEKKFTLPGPAVLKAKLEQLSTKPSEPTRQVDAYYNPRIAISSHHQRSRSGCASAPRHAAVRSTSNAGTPSRPLVKTHGDEHEASVEDIDALRRTPETLDLTPLV
jgi:adenylate cyclase class 2